MSSDAPENINQGLRLRRIEIKNFKRLDHLVVEFPRPRMPGDLDVTVLGSQNGGGKTSVMECIGLLYLAAAFGEKRILPVHDSEWFVDLSDLLIRSGSKQAEISGTFELGNQEFPIGLTISRNEAFKIKEGSAKLQELLRNIASPEMPDEALSRLLAMSSEPLVLPPFLHFNSYRKIQEGSSSMAEMMEGPRRSQMRFSRSYRKITSLSEFKGEMLNLFLGRAQLFEGADAKSSSEGADQLNSILKHYTGGTIEKLKPLPNNGFDFRVSGAGNSGSFAFDGLSSGQKEIVSTLYLIWRHSQNQPCMVLIDEPELHLNAEWHADFVHQLKRYGANNQYILATHSEHIFEAVDEDRRSFLVASDVQA